MTQALTKTSQVTAVGIALGILFWSADIPCLQAQDAERPSLATYVPAQSLSALPAHTAWGGDETGVPLFRDDNSELMAMARATRRVQRWQEFEVGFGVTEKSPSNWRSKVAAAKYNLDQAVFELDNFVTDLEEALTFEHQLDGSKPDKAVHPTRSYFSPWYDIWENSRVKSGVDLDVPAGRVFIGVSLQFPIGD